jgi:hypothetical protein
VPTIYLDHNIVHYFVRGFTESEGLERTALRRALEVGSDVRFVVSDWNFIEPCWEKDPQTGQAELVNRYADFLLSLKPLYLPNVTDIKRAEMKRCVFQRLGLQDIPEVPVFNETYSQARAVSGVEEILLGYTLKDFMRYLVQNPKELDQYRPAQKAVLEAQLTIRRAKETGADNDTNLEKQLWRDWFGSLLPARGPGGRILARKNLDRVLELMVADPSLVFGVCPAINVEHLLSGVRASDPGRRPTIQDGFDLMHSVPALAYCDAIISNDGFVRDCARQVLEKTRRSVVVAKSLGEAIGGLDGMPSGRIVDDSETGEQ